MHGVLVKQVQLFQRTDQGGPAGVRRWRWGAEQRSPRVGSKAGGRADPRRPWQPEAEEGAACQPLLQLHEAQPATRLSAAVTSSRSARRLERARLCCGQTEIPALRSCHPNSSGWLHKHHHRLDTLGKQGATARPYPAPERHKVCHAGRSPLLNRVGT